MTVMRVERVVYGVPNLDECVQFFDDFGLERLDGDGPGVRFQTLLGQVVELRPADDPGLPPALEEGPTLREVVWGVDTTEALAELATALGADRETQLTDGEVRSTDETGFGVGLAVSQPLRPAPTSPDPTGPGRSPGGTSPSSHPAGSGRCACATSR